MNEDKTLMNEALFGQIQMNEHHILWELLPNATATTHIDSATEGTTTFWTLKLQLTSEIF